MEKTFYFEHPVTTLPCLAVIEANFSFSDGFDRKVAANHNHVVMGVCCGSEKHGAAMGSIAILL